MADFTAFDSHMMRAALTLAARGVGTTAPNPSVGCVLVKDAHVIARGWTQPGGRPHAEAMALAAAGKDAQGTTAYVTLEPCAHHGKSPPCADALIQAKVARVVCAMSDPFAQVDGAGFEKLQAAGIAVECGLFFDDALALNTGFFSTVVRARPWVTLKTATSLDGKIATAMGQSKWITGPEARRHGHMLRARNDAILVGSGTLASDDPDLSCRLGGLESASPTPIVLCGSTPPKATAKLVRHAEARGAIFICTGDMPMPVPTPHVVRVPGKNGRPNIAEMLGVLAGRGITRLLVEGGAQTAAAFLKADLVDAVASYRAPFAIGGDGLDAIAPLGGQSLSQARHFLLEQSLSVGHDRLDLYIHQHSKQEIADKCSPVSSPT